MRMPPATPVPLEHLDPQTPQLSQLVSQWQNLWHQALARQSRLDQHQQMLREVAEPFEASLEHGARDQFPYLMF